MALAMEGFSIREYVSRMRSVDVGKCWPFDEGDEEAVLPPITIKKFRWWFDELELKEGNKGQDHEEESDLELETLESLRMKRVHKGKSKKEKQKAKAPKKRSIVELFAVAPQVERVNSDDDEDGEISDNKEDSNDDGTAEEDGSGRNARLVCETKKKVHRKVIVSMLKKEKMVRLKNLKNKDENKKKKEKKGKKIAVDPKIPKKEKNSKLKQQTSVDGIANSNCSTYNKDLLGAISTHMKKPRLKHLTKEKGKCKPSSTPKLISNDQQAVFPVRGILKNHKEVLPAENSTDTTLQDASNVFHSETQHVNKHVTFSGGNDVLEPRRKLCPDVELALQNFCNSTSVASGASLMTHATERRKSSSIQEMKETEEEISNSTADEVEFQHVTQSQLSGRCHVGDVPNLFLRQHASSRLNLFNKSMSFDQGSLHGESPQFFEGRNRVTLPDAPHSSYSYSSRIPTMFREHNIPKHAVPTFGFLSDASSSSRRLLDLSGCAGPELDSGCSMDYLKQYPQPPPSCLSILHENPNSRPLFHSQNIRDNHNEHSLPYQWLPDLPPKELMRTICSLPDRNSGVAMCGEATRNEDFVGLPLNSQGEFINVNSSGQEGFNHLRSMNTIRGPSFSSAMHNNILSNTVANQIGIRGWNGIRPCINQQNSCRIKDPGKEIENFALPSRLDIIKPYGTGKSAVMKGFDPYFSLLESDTDKMKASQLGSRQNNPAQKHPGDEIIRHHGNADNISLHVTRSTMRLMGQEFTVGGRDFLGLEDREVWTDKQIITEHCGAEASSFKCQDLPEFIVHPILGKLKETATHLSKAEIKQMSEGVPQMMVPESMISAHFFDSHNTLMQQNGVGTSKGTLLPKMYPQFSLVTSPLPESEKSKYEPFSFAYNSPTHSSRVSIPASSLLDSNWNVSRSGTHLENKQTPVHATHLAFEYPFPYSECGRHIHPSRSQNSLKFMPPWLLDTRKKGTLMGHCDSYFGPGGVYHSSSMSGYNYPTDPSVFDRPEPFCSLPHSGSENSFASPSLTLRPCAPVHHGFSPNSSMQNRHKEKIKFDDQIKSKFSVRIANHGKRSKKRLPSALDDSMKSSKLPKIGMTTDFSYAVTEVETGNNSEGDVQCSRQVPKPALVKADATTTDCGQCGINKDELGNCTGVDSFKHEGASRSGPIKLTAGARYILKPSQNNNQANSKPTNSTIPLATSTTDGMALGYEKSSKVYWF